jgi:hypothetical protein
VGHKRLLRLPATQKWQQVVELVAGKAKLEAIAAAAAEAAEGSLPIASKDPALIRAFWLLTQIPLAARSQEFGEGLRTVGVDAGPRPSLVDVVAALPMQSITTWGAPGGALILARWHSWPPRRAYRRSPAGICLGFSG